MEKWGGWYENYKDEMEQAMKTDENNKKELASEVIKKYKQVSSSIHWQQYFVDLQGQLLGAIDCLRRISYRSDIFSLQIWGLFI